MTYNFPVTRTTHPKERPADETKLGFAKYFTDHKQVFGQPQTAQSTHHNDAALP